MQTLSINIFGSMVEKCQKKIYGIFVWYLKRNGYVVRLCWIDLAMMRVFVSHVWRGERPLNWFAQRNAFVSTREQGNLFRSWQSVEFL